MRRVFVKKKKASKRTTTFSPKVFLFVRVKFFSPPSLYVSFNYFKGSDQKSRCQGKNRGALAKGRFLSFPVFAVVKFILKMSRSPSDDEGRSNNENSHERDRREGGDALVETAGAAVERHHYDDPESRTAELLAAALDEQPKGFLQYDQPVVLRPSAQRSSSGGDTTAGGEIGRYLQSMAPFIPPYIQQQSLAISEKPIVTTTDKILPAVLPPRRFAYYDERTGADVEVIQPVSKQQALREDLHNLEQLLDFKLKDSKARMMGLCPVRSAIVEMAAEELLRQIVIDLPERGLLLRRVLNESRMTTDAWRSLNVEATLYCTRQLHDGAKGNPEILDKIVQLTSQVTTLRATVKSLETKHASLERSVAEQVQADQKRYNEEKAFLDNTRKRLQQHLDNVKHMQDQERKALMGLAEPVAA
jgi:hypothetical protein